MSNWLSNIVSVILLTLVWTFVFERRAMPRQVNLLFFAALCLPFAEVLTVKAGMRLIATDWIALVLIVTLIGRLRLRSFEGSQAAAIWFAACLGLIPVVALPLFDPAQVSAMAGGSSSNVASQSVPHAFFAPYLTYGVEAVRWLQQCALLIAVVAVGRNEKRWEALIDWAIVGSTVNCLYGLYQASRYWWGWVDLPLLPFTYGRHFARADGYARATGFMWEPTVFGSFTALALLLVLYRLATSAPTKRSWAILVLHVAALVLSFSAVGLMAGLIGWMILLVWPAAGSTRGTGARYPPRLVQATAVAGVVVGLLAFSPEVRWDLWGASRKVLPLGRWAPSSRVERKELLSGYKATVLSQFGAEPADLRLVVDASPPTWRLPNPQDLQSVGYDVPLPTGQLSGPEDRQSVVDDTPQLTSQPARPNAPRFPRRAITGLGMGHATYVTGGGLSLPLKVLVEQGLLGLVLFAGLGLAVVCHVWRSCLALTSLRAAFVTALLVSLSLVVATQGKSKVNFVFFMAGLLLAVPLSRGTVPGKESDDD